MHEKYLFTSARLGFRNWQESDKLPFAKMNANTEVMRYFPATLNQKESDELLDRLDKHFKKFGFTFFAVEEISTNNFIGFIGLIHTSFKATFTPCVEIGWRLDNSFWQKGYATEGAKKCIQFAKDTLKLNEIYSFTALDNTPSEKVMQKIGMQKQGTFLHPKLPDKHWLKEELLYKITL